MLWRTELRKHLPIFATVWMATLAAGVAAAIAPHVVVLEVVHALCGMLCWTASSLYAASVLFRFIALGDDLFLQISSVSRWKLALLKVALLGALMVVQHLIAVGTDLGQLRNAAGTSFNAAVLYMLLAKTLSIAAFLALVLLAATSAKTLPGRGASGTFFGLAVVATITAQAILLWRIGAPATQDFFIGVGGEMFTVNLYANLLPLTLTAPDSGFIPPITGTSVALNAAGILVFIGCWAVLIRARRFNFLQL